ncbi:MAG TPA: hypothetical protein VGG58_04005 [Candidatus Acidoferrum sp.]
MNIARTSQGVGMYSVEDKPCAFEIDGKVYFTDKATLDTLIYQRDHGSLRIAQWIFAMSLAVGRIEST